MIHSLTICMFIFQGLAMALVLFLGIRYRANIASIWISGSKAAWSRIFLLFIVTAFLTEALTWTQGYVKCLDTSDALERLLPAHEAAHVCDMWQGINVPLKQALFTLYLIFELVAVCSFQALVLERYRKVAHLFPDWTSKHALPIYTAAYVPIGFCACLTSLLEFWLSTDTIIERSATINTISSAFYCIWIVLTGLTDAVLSYLIVSKVRRAKAELFADSERAGGTETGGEDLSPLDRQQFSRLRQLQIFFAIIVLFDISILSLTALKKLNGNGIHGHVFAYEVASIEIGCTLIHCTLTLCFMQLLGVILRQSQPQFEFVINSEKVRRGPMSRITIEADTTTSSTMSGMTEDLEEYNKTDTTHDWKSHAVVTQTTDLGSQPPTPSADSHDKHEITIVHTCKT